MKDLDAFERWPKPNSKNVLPLRLAPGRSWRVMVADAATMIGTLLENTEAQAIKIRVKRLDAGMIEIVTLGEGCPAVGACPAKAKYFAGMVTGFHLDTFDMWLHENGWFWFENDQEYPGAVEILLDCVTNKNHET